jgi:hypothetical protein
MYLEGQWESASKRASADTKEWLLNRIWAWFLAFIIPGGSTMIAVCFIPTTASVPLAALYGFIGGVCGLILLFATIYLAQFCMAPYKQRNEARSIVDGYNKLKSPPNREAIIKAMAHAMNTAIDVYGIADKVRDFDIKIRNVTEASRLLDTEIKIAGQNYKDAFIPFKNLISMPIFLKAFLGLAKKLEPSDFDDAMEYEEALDFAMNNVIEVIDGKQSLASDFVEQFEQIEYVKNLLGKFDNRIKGDFKEDTLDGETQDNRP